MISADCVVSGCRQLVTCRRPASRSGGRRSATSGVVEDGWIASNKGEIVFVGTADDFRGTVQAAPAATWIDGRDERRPARLRRLPTPIFPSPGTGNTSSCSGSRARPTRSWPRRAWASRRRSRPPGPPRRTSSSLSASRGSTRCCSPGRRPSRPRAATASTSRTRSNSSKPSRRSRERTPWTSSRPSWAPTRSRPSTRAGRPSYIELIIDSVLPEIKARGLAEFFDIFCEPNVFDLEETKRLAEAARAAGLGVKIHADEFVPIGGAEYAAESGAVSAEHLINVDG